MMMFDPAHYVPVLKVKSAEKRALCRIDPAIAARVTPLLEVVERKEKQRQKSKKKYKYLPPVDEHLDEAFNGLAHAIASFGRYFLDCREIAPDGAAAAAGAFARAEALGLPFVPVTSISRTADVAAALSHRERGVAVRLSYDEFLQGKVRAGLPGFMKKHGLQPGEIDLIVDLGAIDHLIPPAVAERGADFLAEVPDHADWRTFTLSACDFPKVLKFDPDTEGSVSRLQWNYWAVELERNRKSLARLPTFSDCGIQHRMGVEGIDFSKVKPAAAIRYSLRDSWYIARGRIMKGPKNRGQFPGLARKVVAGVSAREGHCSGCADLIGVAGTGEGYGKLEGWRELGTIHHITLTVESLAALSWP